MDPLSALIEQLQREAAELEKPLKVREAREDAELATQKKRTDLARTQLADTRLALSQCPPALVRLEARSAELNRRINGWRGELFRIGYGSAAVLTVPLVITGFALWRQWLDGSTAGLVLLGQAIALTVLYFLIPEKR